METKEELVEGINKVLGIQIDSLSRMNLDDLKILRDALTKIAPQGQQMFGKFFNRPLREVLNEKVMDKSLGELSLMELLGMENKEGGILGFGFLPKIRSIVTGDKKPT